MGREPVSAGTAPLLPAPGTPGCRTGPTGAVTGGRLARNALFNLAGYAVPLLVAVVAIPRLAAGLGTERFGLLALSWAMIGYFSLFDLGVARALTKLVAERIGTSRDEEAARLVWTGLALMGALGLAGTLVLGAAAPFVVRDLLRVPDWLAGEALRAAYLVAVFTPVVISTAGLRGILEAQQRFGLVNAIRIYLGVFTFLGPLCVLPFSSSVVPIVAVLGAGRIGAGGAYFLLCLRVTPVLWRRREVRWGLVGPLLRFGGWMTVTNLVNPLMMYLDRFLVGSFLSLTAVAYYATPYELATKVMLVAEATAGVLFPAVSASAGQGRPRPLRLFERALTYVFLAVFPVVLVMVGLAYEGIGLWLGPEFARNSGRVLQWLGVGVFLGSFSHIAFALIQGLGRPDLTAKVHLVEVPIFLLLLWWMTSTYGIEGAASAWCLRAGADSLVLVTLACRLLGSGQVVRRAGLPLAAAVGALVAAAAPAPGVGKAVFVAAALAAFGVLAWRWMLDDVERQAISSIVRGAIGRRG